MLAVAPSGDAARAAIGPNGAFSLALTRKFKGASLHVVDADGGYAGPVVLRARRGKAYTNLAVTRGRLGVLAAKGGWYAARGVKPRFTLGTHVLATPAQPSTGVTVEVQLTAAGEDRPGGNDRGTQTLAVRLP